MKNFLVCCWLVVCTAFASGAAVAAFDPVNDDTDIFLANPSITAERPNVLIILDNTANWNNAFTNEKSALVSVVNGLSDSYNVGLMLFPETGNPNDNVDGGYMKFGVRQMTFTNKTSLASIVGGLDILKDKGNNATTGLAMYEAYLYYAGKASLASFGKAKTDFAGNTNLCGSNPAVACNPAGSLAGNALPATPTSSSLYNSPIADGCQKNFIIYISNGPANENAQARATLSGFLSTLTGASPPNTLSITPVSANGQEGNWADEMAQYLANADVSTAKTGTQSVITYTVEVDPGTTGGGPDMTALLKNMANVGKGKYFAVTSGSSGSGIIDALNTIFSEVQAVNSVFASTTLPVSVNVRGTNLNQVYIGVFRPDSHKSPRWLGNLKLYDLVLNGSLIYLADQNGVKAEDSTTGFISSTATSFWTSGTLTPTNFWSYRTAAENGVGGASDAPDGDLVEKGGVAQQIRHYYETSQAARKLYTCTPAGMTTPACTQCTPSGAVGSATCAGGSNLSDTPFNDTNTAINTTTLNLQTRIVSPLSANQSRNIESIESRRQVTLTNFWTNSPATVTLSNGATSRATISNLDASVAKVITNITAGSAPTSNTQTTTVVSNSTNTTTTITNTSPASTSSTVTAVSTLSWPVTFVHANGNTNNWTATFGTAPAAPSGTYTVAPTINALVSSAWTLSNLSCFKTGTGTGAFTSIGTATGAITAGRTTGGTAAVSGSTTFNDPSNVVSTCTATATLASSFTTTVSVTSTVNHPSTTATATTSTPHGFVSGQAVAISGTTATFQQSSSSTSINTLATCNASGITPGTGTSACLYDFTYTLAISAYATSSGANVGTASGGSTTAIATAPNSYAVNDVVTIVGASPAAFNGVHTITYADANTFKYTLGTIQSANTATYPLYAYKGTASTTVTATAPPGTVLGDTTYGMKNGQTVTISGAGVAGYNASFTITCTADGTGNCLNNVFTFNTATALPPETAPGIQAAGQGGTYPWVLIHTNPDAAGLSKEHYFGTHYPYNSGWSNTWDIPVIIERTDGVSDCFTGTYSSANRTGIWGYQDDGAYMLGTEYLYVFLRPKAACGSYDPANSATWWTTLPSPTPGATYTIRLRDFNMAYVRTTTQHYYPSNQQVTISGVSPSTYNGTFTAHLGKDDSAVAYYVSQGWYVGGPYTREFTYDMTMLPANGVAASASVPMKSTITTTVAQGTSAAHGFGASNATLAGVTIGGATPAAFNGSKTILVVDPDTFVYCLSTPNTVPVYVPAQGVYTCAAGTPEGDASGSITANTATIADPNLNQAVVNWVRGADNFENENHVSPDTLTDIRASIHGDVLHSRPAVINYNRHGTDNDVYVFYGANDAIFHAIQGGMASDVSDPDNLTAGQEAWGFIPQEFFGSLQRLRNNSPAISSSNKKPYFADGPIGVYTKDGSSPVNGKLGDHDAAGNNIDTVNLYIGMRRGGKTIYALDVNDPNVPRYMWSISNSKKADGSSSTDFQELGQTWSEPKVVDGISGYHNPVLIFGAGYDPAVEDIDPQYVTASSATSVTYQLPGASAVTVNRSMGRGIYVVDAITGEKVVSIGGTGSGADLIVPEMAFAIPSDMTVIQNLSGSATNRAYVGDTGGNLWRMDFNISNTGYIATSAANRAAWVTVTNIASIGNQSTFAGRRKFFYPPDIVAGTGFDSILIGSGDREHPFDGSQTTATYVVNRMYMFKDRGTDAGPVTGVSATYPTITETGAINEASALTLIASAPAQNWLYDATNNCLQQACTGTSPANEAIKMTASSGWYVTLGVGEKVIGNAVALGGTVFFNTNQPSATSNNNCGSNLGTARQYQVSVTDATATSNLDPTNAALTLADRSKIHAGGGYLPSPVHVVIGFNVNGQTVIKEAVISGTEVTTPTQTPLMTRFRKYWYKEIDQ